MGQIFAILRLEVVVFEDYRRLIHAHHAVHHCIEVHRWDDSGRHLHERHWRRHRHRHRWHLLHTALQHCHKKLVEQCDALSELRVQASVALVHTAVGIYDCDWPVRQPV